MFGIPKFEVFSHLLDLSLIFVLIINFPLVESEDEPLQSRMPGRKFRLPKSPVCLSQDPATKMILLSLGPCWCSAGRGVTEGEEEEGTPEMCHQ